MIPLWVVLFVVLLFCGIKIAAENHYKEAQKLFKIYDENILEWLFSEDFEAMEKMVVIGNSRMRHAFPGGNEEPTTLALDNGRELAVLQYSFDAAYFDDYQRIADQIIAKKPDYIVIQKNVITNDHIKQPYFLAVTSHMGLYVVHKIGGLGTIDEWIYQRANMVDDMCFSDFVEKRVKLHTRLMNAKRVHDLSADNESYAHARAFIKKALDAGIRVIVISVDSNLRMLEQAGVDRLEIDFHGLPHMPTRQEILPDLYRDVTWLAYQPAHTGEYYCDIIHLNKQGRAKFKSWFIDNIQMLK